MSAASIEAIAALLANAGGRHGVLTGTQRARAGELLDALPETPQVFEAKFALRLRNRSRTVDSRIGRDYLLRDKLGALVGEEVYA